MKPCWRWIVPAALSSVWVLTAGCYRSVDTTWHTPHVYKGAQDPLLARLRQADFQQQLEKRFRTVQTDR